ncbi:MAG: metal-dependent transcriptional regulator [Candidatus Micrarchaeia archaeon]
MLSQKAEDYLEAILIIVEKRGYARPRDIAKKLGVKPPSVTEMLLKLSETGYIEYEKYGEAVLTAQGMAEASKVKKRHEIFEKLLKMLLVPREIAERDACILEHNLHHKTNEQISRFVEFVGFFEGGPVFLEHFKEYSENGKTPKKCKKMGKQLKSRG